MVVGTPPTTTGLNECIMERDQCIIARNQFRDQLIMARDQFNMTRDQLIMERDQCLVELDECNSRLIVALVVVAIVAVIAIIVSVGLILFLACLFNKTHLQSYCAEKLLRKLQGKNLSIPLLEIIVMFLKLFQSILS